MADVGSYRGSYTYSAEFGEGIQVLYTYSETDPFTENTTVSYTFSDGSSDVPHIRGNTPAATQEIMNNLPLWMEMRKNRDSTGFKLVNAWGSNLEEVVHYFNKVRDDQFLVSADPLHDVTAGISELSFQEEAVYVGQFDNILFNSSFSLQSIKRTQRPEGWNVSRDNLDALQFDKTSSLFGNHALSLGNSYGPVELKQERNRILIGGPIAYSIYVKTDSNGLSTTDRYEPDEAGLILVVKYVDGTVKSFGVGFPYNTQGKYVRASLLVNLEQETVSFESMIVHRIGGTHTVDLPMLNKGNAPKAWTPSIVDKYLFTKNVTRGVTGVQVLSDTEEGNTVGKVELQPLVDDREFLDVRIPTRIEPYYPKIDPEHIVNSALGRHINYFGEHLPLTWPASNGKIQEKSAITPDIYNQLIPVDLYLTEQGVLALDTYMIDNPLDISVKASIAYDDILYVVTKETYAGKTAHYLKFVQTNKLSFNPDYLESLYDLRLDIPIGDDLGIDAKPEEINRIGVCKNLANVIFVDTDRDRRFYFELKFDYYYANFSKRKIFCREHYLDEGAHLQVI